MPAIQAYPLPTPFTRLFFGYINDATAEVSFPDKVKTGFCVESPILKIVCEWSPLPLYKRILAEHKYQHGKGRFGWFKGNRVFGVSSSFRHKAPASYQRSAATKQRASSAKTTFLPSPLHQTTGSGLKHWDRQKVCTQQNFFLSDGSFPLTSIILWYLLSELFLPQLETYLISSFFFLNFMANIWHMVFSIPLSYQGHKAPVNDRKALLSGTWVQNSSSFHSYSNWLAPHSV